MSEYKRFISYVYEYPNYQKGPNRGFMKVECRNGLCQMSFSLRGLCRDDNGEVKIYGFRRQETHLQGSLLSSKEVQNGTLDLQLQFPDHQIGEQQYIMEDLAGVILICNDTLFYATQWDDDPLNLENFSADVPQEPEGVIPEIPENMDSIPEADIPIEAPEEPIPVDTAPAGTVPAGSAPASIVPEGTVPENTPVESVPEDTIPNEPLPPNVSPENAPEIPTDTFPKEPIPIEEVAMEIPSTDAASEANEPEKLPPDDIHATSTECPSDTPQTYFRDGCIVNCVRITPKDICRLHPSDWYLSNNRFVHYGQQTFGHLLIGQLTDSGQTVLCVPGIYHQQERMLANMYGFNCFIQCPGQKNTLRNFGYWYRSIQPTNLNPENTLS